MATTEILAAEFYQGGRQRPPVLRLARIAGGRRQHLETIEVADKREARRIAKERAATPWNF